MLMFSQQFLEKNSFEIEYKGEKVSGFYSFDRKGTYILRFTFIKIRSSFRQAIILHLDTFKGRLFINGEEIARPKGMFPQLVFSENESPKQFDVQVVLEEGNLVICNGSDPLGDGLVWYSISQGCAIIIKKLHENYLRFFCNDHENDDDFDDLVFDLEILCLQ